MKSREQILARKAQLVERIAGQRDRLAGQVESLQPLFRLADKGIAAVQAVRAHPGWVALVAGIIIATRPRRALAWARRGFLIWRSVKWAQRALAGAIANGINRI